MKLLVIGAGMMGSAAAYDMARSAGVEAVTLADADGKLAKREAARINKMLGGKKVKPVELDASKYSKAQRLMNGHDGALSAVPYFFNVGLAKAAIEAKCHFADLGGNNTVVKKTYGLARQAAKRGVGLAPDCGLSPGMASILAGELMRRVAPKGEKVEALKLYVGGLPKHPRPPFYYQLVFSVNGLINEFVEPAKVLKGGKKVEVEPLTEPEEFRIDGFAPLTAFHTSGGTSTMPDTYEGQVGECFEKTLRYPAHYTLIRSLYDLGMFSSDKKKFGKAEVSPREMTAQVFLDKWSGDEPDVCIMRIEAHKDGRVASFTMVDEYDPATKMTAMMRTTAWPASIVLQMMCDGRIAAKGGVYQEKDVPGAEFLREMGARGVKIDFAS